MLRQAQLLKVSPAKVLTGITAAGLLSAGVFAAESQMSLSPSSSNVRPGDTVTVRVDENSGTRAVNGVEADISYPADKFDVVSIDSAASAFDIKARETSSQGRVSVIRGKLGETLTGSHEVTKIVLKAKASGSANITVDGTSMLVASDNNTNILQTSTGTTVTISQPAPAATPVVTPAPVATPAATPEAARPAKSATSAPVVAASATATPAAALPGTTNSDDLPVTGPESVIGGAAGLGALGYAGTAWFRSKRKLTGALRNR